MSDSTKPNKPLKTLLDKIVYAIRNQPPSATGVSRVAIAKYLKNELQYDNANKLKQALKKAVNDGKLVQTGQSFRVAGDPVVAPPHEETVEVKDIKLGKAGEDEEIAERGDTVTVKYEGRLEDGTVFDSAPTFKFTLGAGEVIKGWDMGIAGMRVQGQRELEVPSKLGYGKRGSAPDIPPNADLFFTVTLKKIKKNA